MILFKDWKLSLTGDRTLAHQYDNLTRRLEVMGNLPEGWEWAMLVEVKEANAMDVIPLEPMEGGVGHTLTEDQLSIGNEFYNVQLRGTRGEEVRHTNIVQVFVAASISGIGQWPTAPGGGSVEVDATLSKKGAAADAKAVGDKISQLSEDMANLQTSGLTTAQVNALDGLFKIGAYTEDASAAYAAFKTAFGLSDSDDGGGDSGGSEEGGSDTGGETETQTYTVTNNLTDVTNSNSDTTATGFYSATLSVEDGYSIAVTITMGGVDITADVYGEGNILIPEVTGDIVITAEATLPAAAYTLTNKTFTGTAEEIIDTGVAIDDTTKDWSIFIDFTGTSGTPIFANADANGYIRFQIKKKPSTGTWHCTCVTNEYDISNSTSAAKCVITHTAGEKPMIYGVVDGELVSHEAVTRSSESTYNVQIGAKVIPSGTSDYFVGTINTAEVYLSVLPEDEIKKKLGVA